MNPEPYDGPERRQVETARYTGPDRRAQPGDTAFERAVEEAASNAAQRVSRVHRVRLVTQAAIAAFAASFLINALIGLIYQQQARTDAAHFAQSNCRLLKDMSGAMVDFVDTDAALRAAESRLSNDPRVRAGDNRVYGKTLVGQLLYVVSFDEAWAVHRWRFEDEARLRALTRVNCAARLKP